MEAAGLHETDRFGAAGYAFVSRPNRSLDSHQQHLAVLAVAAPCVGIALLLASYGYWLVLPFAGLEVGLLLWAFAQLREHDGDYESITIRGDRLLLEWRDAGRLHRRELNTLWTRVETAGDLGTHRGCCVRSHGEATELGRYLGDEERLALARTLAAELRRGAV